MTSHWFPLRDPPSKLRIALIPNERPALFVYTAKVIVLFIAASTVLNECFGVLHIAVDSLNGCCNAILLCGQSIERQPGRDNE